MFGHGVTDLGQFATKTVAHGVSGGLQNMIQGGDFGSGFMSGSVGHATGFVGGSIGGDVGGIVGSGLGGGISSSLSGGDFGRGFQTGAMQYLFNRMGEGIVKAGVNAMNDLVSGGRVSGRNLDGVQGMNPAFVDGANKYGPDALGLVGAGMQMLPHPAVQALGSGMAGVGAVWGGVNTVRNPTVGNVFFTTISATSPLLPVFGFTRSSASLLYTIGN